MMILRGLNYQVPPSATNDNIILRAVFQENNTSSRAIASRADYIERLKRAKGYLYNG